MGAEGKNLEICHSRLLENVFTSTRTAKNVSWQQWQKSLTNLMMWC